MTKRFNIEFDGHQYFLILDEVNERCLAKLDTRIDALAWLEMYKMLLEENEQLKEELKELKIDNKAKDDAIDGLQLMMAHYNLEDLE